MPEFYSGDGSHGGTAIGGCFQNQITASSCHLPNPSSQSSVSLFIPGVLHPTPKYVTHDPICLWANSQLNCLISILGLYTQRRQIWHFTPVWKIALGQWVKGESVKDGFIFHYWLCWDGWRIAGKGLGKVSRCWRRKATFWHFCPGELCPKIAGNTHWTEPSVMQLLCNLTHHLHIFSQILKELLLK